MVVGNMVQVGAVLQREGNGKGEWQLTMGQ